MKKSLNIADKLKSSMNEETKTINNKLEGFADRFEIAEKLLNKEPVEPVKKEVEIESKKIIEKPSAKVNKKALRHTFTLLQEDVDLMDQVINKMWEDKVYINRSEFIRAMLNFSKNLSTKDIKQAYDKIEKLSVGAPKKHSN